MWTPRVIAPPPAWHRLRGRVAMTRNRRSGILQTPRWADRSMDGGAVVSYALEDGTVSVRLSS